jgi:serine/threonine-protein kinase
MYEAAPTDAGTPGTMLPGSVVGSYRLGRRIARGGMGMVYEAAHVILPRRAAVKVMHPELIENQVAVQRMLQEACILEAFAHPGVVKVFECGTLPDGRVWLAMELIGGRSLSGHLACLGPLRVDELLGMIGTIADVLAAAHRSGIVHRDLKPENILVVGSALADLRLIDWGIALQPTLGPRLTLEDTTVGTPTYMAPEQVRGLRPDGRADVYALGVLAYEAATGTPPFTGPNGIEVALKHLTDRPLPLRVHRSDLPGGLASLIDRMLIKDPELRPTMAEICERLRVIAGVIAEVDDDEDDLDDDDEDDFDDEAALDEFVDELAQTSMRTIGARSPACAGANDVDVTAIALHVP